MKLKHQVINFFFPLPFIPSLNFIFEEGRTRGRKTVDKYQVKQFERRWFDVWNEGRKINGYIRCPSVTANFFYFLNKSTELDHPPTLCFVNPPSSTTYLTRTQRTYLQAFLLLSQETELGPLEFTSFPLALCPRPLISLN